MGKPKKEVREMKSEYEYVMSIGDELGQHLGEWIAVIGEEIVAHSENFKEVYETTKSKYPNKEPFIMKIPRETVMLL